MFGAQNDHIGAISLDSGRSSEHPIHWYISSTLSYSKIGLPGDPTRRDTADPDSGSKLE